MSDKANVQRSTKGRCEKHEDDVKKYQWPFQPNQPKFLHRVLIGAKHNRIAKNFPPPYLLPAIATLLICFVPQNQPIKTN